MINTEYIKIITTILILHNCLLVLTYISLKLNSSLMESSSNTILKDSAVVVANGHEKNVGNEKTKIDRQFSEKYFLDETLGTGGFSVVKKCRYKDTEEQFAAKIVDVQKLKESKQKEIELEVNICLKLQHCNVVRLFEFYPDTNFLYMIFELVTGGELFEDIVERERYSEIDASECIQQIFEAVCYCHSKGIVHRDIKPENLLLASNEPGAKIKLADFGLAVEGGDSPKWHGLAGTPCYIAPEVLQRQPYDVSVDCWACGCILYLLLIGYPPFWNSNQKKLFETIKEGIYDFDSSSWQSISYEAKSLIRTLLTVNVKRRLLASDALNSRWINQRQVVAFKHHRKNTIKSLKAFNARRKFKGAVRTTLLATAQGLGRRRNAAS